jgi:hypothetical protein
MIPKETAFGLLGQVVLVGLALIHQPAVFVGAAETAGPIRFATFNASLNRNAAGQLITDLRGRDNRQAGRVAEIIQRVRPQVLLINEFDYDPDGTAARFFQENYLNVSQHGQAPIRYAERFIAPVNTGVATGFDLDGNGRSDGPGDAFGFGRFPGQYGMLVLSVFPIDRDHVRTFQKFLWKDMPGGLVPVRRGAKSLQALRHKPADASVLPDRQAAEAAEQAYYSTAQWQILRLSSKSHWDLPLKIRGSVVHFLVCHPTPPIFDGPEDRNGCRNHDEIRLLADYIDPGRSSYIYADQGHRGGLPADARFVIAGDMNADPTDGDSTVGSIRQLLEHPLINGTCRPTSRGGPEQAKRQGGANRQQQGDPALDTADFSDRGPGNLRVDYVLPSRQLTIAAAGVYWPASDDPGYPLVRASDHRLVWVDVE